MQVYAKGYIAEKDQTLLESGLKMVLNLYLFSRGEFDKILKNALGAVKPFWIITVDGSPDENPRYAKVIGTGIHHF